MSVLEWFLSVLAIGVFYAIPIGMECRDIKKKKEREQRRKDEEG